MAAKTAILDKLVLNAPHLSAKTVIPGFVYGTAWKKEATSDLVYQALSNGFTAIDTACQPKHYREDLVGQGLRRAINHGLVKRADIYVQTKFTSIGGQDPNNIPYDPKKPIAEQVRQSLEVSLKHLDVSLPEDLSDNQTYIDSVVLHSPMQHIDETMEVWQTLESFVPQKIHNIGISNCDLFTLMDIYERATIKPAVVQNRFYPRTKFDIGVRKFCQEHDIIYQSFWTLTANPDLVRSTAVQELSTKLNIAPASALYCLVLGLGNTVVLNGSTNLKHIRDDWTALTLVKDFSTTNEKTWISIMDRFRESIGGRL